MTRAIRLSSIDLDLAAGELHKNGLKVRLRPRCWFLEAVVATKYVISTEIVGILAVGRA